jgi:hypothetical protein
MNGVEMLRDIASTNPSVRALLISGFGAPQGLPRQVCCVLQKPFRPAQLIDAVRRHFDWSGGEIVACAPEPQIVAAIGQVRQATGFGKRLGSAID